MANRFLNNIRINDAYTFPASDGNDGQVITTDGAGNLAFENVSPDAASVIYRDNFTGDGSTVTFDLQNSITDEDQTQIYIDGVYQEKSTYSISGTTITFTTAPILGHSVEVISISSINTGPTVLYQDNFTGNGNDTAFTLGQIIDNEIKTFIFLNGVYQFKNTYTVDGTTLTFDTAPANGVAIEVVSIASAVQSDSLEAGSVIIPVKNTHTASISKGTPVYITGNVGASERLQIAPADASNSAKMPAAGLLLTTLAVNAEGYVITGGYLRNLTTDTIDGTSTSSNDTVYVKAGGGLTMTKPTGSNLIQNIAKVARSASGNSGSLLVSSILRTNDVPNEIDRNINFSDNSKLTFGNITSPDLEIYHDGSHSYINDEGTGSLYIQATNSINLRSTEGEWYMDGIANGAVNLYYDNSKKFETTSTGVGVTGNLSVSGDLTINGTTTTLNTQTVEVEDNILQLNTTQGSPDTATATTSGISVYRGSGVTQASFIFDDADDTWDLTNNLVIAGNVGIGGNNSSYKLISIGDYYPIAWQRSGGTIGTLYSDSTSVGIGVSNLNNAGIFFTGGQHIDFRVNGGTKMFLNSLGNLGIGETPSSWSAFTVLQVEKASLASTGGDMNLMSNSYYDGTAYKYIGSGGAARQYYNTDGTMHFYNASIGTAGGTVTWNERMRIDSSGNVGIGTTSPGTFYPGNHNLVVGDGNADSAITVYANPANTSYLLFADGTSGSSSYTAQVRYNHSTNHMEFATNNSTAAKMTLDDNGNLGIAETSPNGKLDIKQDMTAGTTAAFTSPHLRLSANNTVDNTGFVGMTFATSTANNYGFSWGALRTTQALGGMHLRYHGNSASGTDIFSIDYVGNVTIATQRYIRSDSSGGWLTIQGGATYPGGKIDMYGGSNPAAGIEFLTGGTTTTPTERMRIDTLGNIKVGTDTPLFLYSEQGVAQVAANRVSSNGTIIDTSSSAAYINLYTPTAGSYITFHTANAINTSPTERMRITPGGTITIGAPSSIATSAKLQLGEALSAGSSAIFQANGFVRIEHGLLIHWDSDNAYAGYLQYSGTNGFSFTTEGAGSGNVGIGTTTPQRKLDVAGTALIANAGNINKGTLALGVQTSGSSKWSTITGAHYNAASGSGNGSGSAGIMMIGTHARNGENDVVIGGSIYEANAATSIQFWTHTTDTSTAGGTERMRITSGGNVLMGGHAANGSINPVLNGYGFQANGLATGVCNFSGTNEMFVLNQRDGTGTTQLEFRNGNVERGRIEWTTSATTYNTISDYRLKENINNLTDSLLKINQLQPKSFNFISDPNELRIGFIAHEVQEIVPQAVTGTKDEIREDNTPKYQGLDNSMLVPLLVGAIKELKAEIETLKNQINGIN